MDMLKYAVILSAFFVNEMPDNLLSRLGEYGVLGIVLGIMLWKDYKNEQFLQKLIGDLRKSLDKLSDKIDKKIQ